MIVEFQPNNYLACYPVKYTLYYKQDDEIYFHKIYITYEQLKVFLETYGYETNNITYLHKFGINTSNIKLNQYL